MACIRAADWIASQVARCIGSAGLLLEHVGQDVAAVVDLLLGQVHGRQQAQHGAVRAVDQQLALQAGLARPARRRSTARCRSSRPARAPRGPGRTRACSASSRCAEDLAESLGVFQQVLVARSSRSRRCRPGRRSGCRRTWRRACRAAGWGRSRAWSAAPRRRCRRTGLGQRHHVGRDAEVLIGEPLAGAAAAGLHFVEDQQQLVLVGQSAAARPGSRRAGC